VLFEKSNELLVKFHAQSSRCAPKREKQLATVSTQLPSPGGIITNTCENPEAVFKLMDLMVSEEASLIARFGQQGVSWDFAELGDILPHRRCLRRYS
jgi:hypothetical protein